MSHKVICLHGHAWDPSHFTSGPAAETPSRCPICGEPARGMAPAMPDDHVHYVTSEPTASAPDSAASRPERWRNLAAIAACALLGIALMVALAAWWRASHRAQDAEEQARLTEQSVGEARRLRVQEVSAKNAALSRARQAEKDLTDSRYRHDAIAEKLNNVKKAREDALRQRDEQYRTRIAAEELAKTADEVRQQAVTQRRAAARSLVKLHAAAGMRLMERGDLPASLLWFAEALRLAQKEKMPDEAHRLRLAAILAQCPRPVQVWAHEKKVDVARLSPDGRRVLTASVDGAATIWDATTGKRVGDPLAHESAVRHASFSGDGKRVLTATTDATVHVWDLGEGKEAFPALQFMGPVVAASFSPDGRRFLTVSYKSAMDLTEAELHIWDAATGEAASAQPLGSEISPRPAAFSPDGRHVLTVCQDRCARVWDIAAEKQVGSAFAHAAALVHASFGPDGKRVLTASVDGTARVWQADTGKPMTPPLKHGAAVRGASFSPDGRYALTIGEDRAVRVWDTSTGDAVSQIPRHPDVVNRARFSPDGRYVLTTCDDGSVHVWDYATGEEACPVLKHNGAILHAEFTPAGDGVLTLSDRVVRLWDLTAAEPAAPPPARPEVGLSVFSADGRRVIRMTGTTAQVHDTAKNQPIGAALEHKHKVSIAAFSPDGKRVLTVSHQPNGDEMEGQVRVWETVTGKAVGEPMLHLRAVNQASFSADGSRVLTACLDRKARVWDADKSRLVGEAMEHKEDISRALFTPEGQVLTVDAEGAIRLWDAATGKAVGATWGHQQAINHLAFRPDRRQLVTASDDGMAIVWETETGRQVAKTAGHGIAVLRAVFSPDGKSLATVSADRMARVWDAATGKPMTPPLRHPATVTLAAFSADGRWLMTAAADGVRMWDAITGEAISPLLKHGPENSVLRDIAFGKDGRLITMRGAPGDPSGQCVRQLKADDRPVNDLQLVARVLSGQRLEGPGETAAYDGAELVKGWQEIRGKYSKDFAPSAARAVAWHRRGAAECERGKLWAGVVGHLDPLIAAGASAELYGRRARANRELRRWEPARADYTKALASDAGNWRLWAGRAEVEAALRRWEQAAADYSQAIERKGDRAELWAGRGRVEAERGDWRKAAADLGKAIAHGDRSVEVWHQHALTLLAGGDEANYRRLCARLVQRLGGSDDEAVARSVAWTCVLAAGSVRDLKPLVRRAERAVAANPQSADDLRRLAALLYRTGQFEAALARLQEVTRLRNQEPQPRDWLLMAMSAQRLGRGAEAKKWLDQAEQKAKEPAQSKQSPWHERLVYQILHGEAEALLKGAKR